MIITIIIIYTKRRPAYYIHICISLYLLMFYNLLHLITLLNLIILVSIVSSAVYINENTIFDVC